MQITRTLLKLQNREHLKGPKYGFSKGKGKHFTPEIPSTFHTSVHRTKPLAIHQRSFLVLIQS